MREIKFRAFTTHGEMLNNVQNHIGTGAWGFGNMLMNPDDFNVMQYTGLKDVNGVEIYEGDLLNIYFTSSNGEYIHDCVYKAVIGAFGDIQFEFVKLLWIDNGNNQYPSSTTLCQRYGNLDYEYKDQVIALKVPDSWHENPFYKTKWKGNDKSFYFEVIGNIYQNPELLK